MCFMTTTLIQPSQPAGSSACHYNPAAMALDTIKSTKNHKTFPFTTPTITTHNKTPTGALILEIIFSDDTSSPNTTQDKGECNEDDNDSDSDEEDDVDSTSNSDAHSNNNDSDSDGDDVDEQDQEHVEDGGGGGGQGDSDDDEEEGHGHEDDEEDFESAFDNDLIIDFGNDNEEDQLVVEFEETHSNKTSPRSSPPPKPVDLPPFWFSHEESDQLCIIFESYGVTLNLEEQRKACIRSPAPFVGRVKRTPIKPAESDTDKDFKTLDKVEIYLRELYPLGTMLPLSRVAWVLTTWDAKDGIPIRSFEIPKNTKNSESMQKRTQGARSSTLYCAPIFGTKEDYQYTVCSQDHSLMYASDSSTNASISSISPFLPAHCRTISFSLD